jgi:hypothetical protein
MAASRLSAAEATRGLAATRIPARSPLQRVSSAATSTTTLLPAVAALATPWLSLKTMTASTTSPRRTTTMILPDNHSCNNNGSGNSNSNDATDTTTRTKSEGAKRATATVATAAAQRGEIRAGNG